MFSFGWVTQSKITRNVKVNNILTRMIKEYLVKKGFERFKAENDSNKNCYKSTQGELYVSVYTRHVNSEEDLSTWAIYKHVKKMAEDRGKRVVLLLGTVVGGALVGKLYKLEAGDIISLFDEKELTLEKYVSITDSMDIVQSHELGDFQELKELHALIDRALEV